MHNRINVSEKNVKTQGHKNKNQKRFHHIVKRFALTKNCGFSSFLFYCCGNQRNFSSKITFYPCLLLRKSFLYQKCIVVTKQNRRLDFRPFQYFLQLSCSFRSLSNFKSSENIIRKSDRVGFCYNKGLQKESTSLDLHSYSY